MDFGYSGNFHLDNSAEEEILEIIENGLSVEDAVLQWMNGLDELDFFIVCEFLKDRIISYIYSLI